MMKFMLLALNKRGDKFICFFIMLAKHLEGKPN